MSKTIRNNIRIERARQKISQEKLAKIVGATRGSINNIENGKSEPKVSIAIKIARFFGIEVEKLFDND